MIQRNDVLSCNLRLAHLKVLLAALRTYTLVALAIHE